MFSSFSSADSTFLFETFERGRADDVSVADDDAGLAGREGSGSSLNALSCAFSSSSDTLGYNAIELLCHNQSFDDRFDTKKKRVLTKLVEPYCRFN